MPTPTTKREWKDEYTLLCERCGYVIEGLDTTGNCPECGKPIEESLPERRVGTPWQQSSGFRSLLKTWWMTLRHPLRTLDVIRFEESRSMGLLHTTLLLPTGLSWLMIIIEFLPNTHFVNWLMLASFLLVAALILAFGIYGMTGSEALGLQFFSRQKKTRITETIAWTVVAHGSIGWVFTFLIWLSAWKLDWLDRLIYPAQTDYEMRQQVYRNATGILIPGFLLGLIVGLLIFETFAYLGLRRCKYANRIRPSDPDRPAAAGSSSSSR